MKILAKYFGITGAILLGSISTSGAQTLTYTSGVNNVTSTVIGNNGGTISGGYATGINGENTSQVDLSAASVYGTYNGTVSNYAQGIVSVNTSQINITGGNVYGNYGGTVSGYAEGIVASDTSVVTISGGNIYGNDGGSVNDYSEGILAASSSTVNIEGGNIYAAFNSASSTDFSMAIDASQNSTVNLSGGNIFVNGSGQSTNNTGILAFDNAVVKIYGSGFNFALGAISAGKGTLTGTLANGSTLDVTFSQENPGQIILIAVPEPSTWAMLAGGLVLLACRCKRTRERI
jgi:hypothetical protein